MTSSPHTDGTVATRRSTGSSLDDDGHPSVLRDPLLGDVQVGHDLET